MNVCALRSYRGVAEGCHRAGFRFIETKSECEQAAAQFAEWAVRDAIQPSWAYGCVLNAKTGIPWFNHAGLKKIQPKDDEYAICRNRNLSTQNRSNLHSLTARHANVFDGIDIAND